MRLLRHPRDEAIRLFRHSTTNGDRILATLWERYSEPGRHYHNLTHIDETLEIVECLANCVSDLTAVRLAVWFHDAVYDTRAKDNEERSADLATKQLSELEFSTEVIARVARLILLTKTHQAEPSDRDGQVLLDADLAILGAEGPRYDEYAAAIRREYAWVADEDYRIGRGAVLETFLNRPRIYFTDTLFGLREAHARKNIEKEIERLSSDSFPN
jgi:predicted metal-dependent HD superfamily phosphohydrolase